MKQITHTKTTIRALRKIPVNTSKHIVSKIRDYAVNPPRQANNVKKLQGRNGIRLRVGDWRVIIEDGIVLAVLDISPRGGIYK